MKPGHILGTAIIGVCILAAGLSLRGAVRHSFGVKEAIASPGEPCTVYGQVVKGTDHYDIRAARLDFLLQDEKGDTMRVLYPKSKPPTFDTAPKVGAAGAYREGAFQADNLILKCPSKYISGPPVPSASTGKGPSAMPASYVATGKGRN